MIKALCCALCLASVLAEAAQRGARADSPFIFLVYFNTTAPFAYRDEAQQRFVGIVPDILREAADAAGIDVVFYYASRKGAEQAMYEGQADGILLSSAWAEYPQRLVFSDPMFLQKEYLYSLTPFSRKTLSEEVTDKVVCTRQNYKYPAMRSLFQSGQSLRNDLSSHAEMLEMLLQGRCDYAYLSEFRALWLLSKHKEARRVYRSDYALDTVPLTLAMNPRRTDFLVALNKHIAYLNRSGMMQSILDENLRRRSRELSHAK